MKSDVVSVMLL